VKSAGNARTVEPSEAQTPQEELEEMKGTAEPATRNGQIRLRKEVSGTFMFTICISKP